MSERIEPVRGLRSANLSDSADLTYGQARGFHCNVAGDVKFRDLGDNDVTLTVLAGIPYPYACKRIWSTGTTATGIFALY